jgi:uncharacterized protein YjeT (DUF2065 family)
MDIIHSIELFLAINFFIIGLSHLVQPKIWVEFFIYLHSKNNAGNIFNALLSLGTGSLIFSFHFIWYWPNIIVTIYGLLQILKGLIYLLKPSVGIASIGKVSMEKANKFRWSGLLSLMLSIMIIYILIKDKAIS